MEGSDLQIVYQDRNYGFGRSIQVGSSLASGDFIYIQFSDLEYELKRCFEMFQWLHDLEDCLLNFLRFYL